MVVVHIESSFDSSGKSSGRSAGGDGERDASSSSVSSSFLEEFVRSPDEERNSPNDVGKRIINEIPIHLLKGDIPIDGSPFEPDGDVYATREDLTWRVNRLYIVSDVEDSILVRPRVPFTEFQMAVLREANVAPAQLHPNSWAAIQAFLAMCLVVGVTPTIPVFFHYFEMPCGPSTLSPAVCLPTVLAVVFVDPSSKAATASAIPLVRKRKEHGGKGHKDKEGSSSRSASKKPRKGKEGSSSRPLPGDVFSPTFSMSDQTKFHMSSSPQASIEPLTEAKLTNAMLEMSTWADSLAWEFADRRGIETVRAELLAEKKNSEGLQVTLHQMLLTHDDYDKKIEQLEADLEKAKKESADATDRLSLTRKDNARLLEECDQLKAMVRAAVVLREELSVHRPTKLTVVPRGTLRSSTWAFAKGSGGSGSSGRTLRSPPGQVDSGSQGNSPFINLGFFERFRRQLFFGKNSPFDARPS
ncbi:hypothetical protein LR48_Vigan05g122100 [Vigna angularis]|uniref:Transposase (putative) gypsy type domain-containing protein n=1 Tax=Phaseolus angularis TaxID=3914 RepID=A0A0L9ULN2_PHAAN|nr:hypothetical protein LR48_Vigan05g122100 [Vigna angularis]